MRSKIKKSIILILCLFISGNMFTYIGFTKGREIAISLSRPSNAMSWTTSEEMIKGCTYVPVITGISIIVMAIILSTVLFIKWLNNDIKER